MKKHTKILCMVLLSVCISGCMKENTDESLYTMTQDTILYSSQQVYDYCFYLNDLWNLSDSDNDNFQYTNDSNEDSIYVFRNYGAVNAESYSDNLQCSEIPEYVYPSFSALGLDADLISESENGRDYTESFKFFYSYGKYDEKHYQAIYFQSENIIPSVSGSIVPNCIMIIYSDDDSTSLIRNFLSDIEKSIDYE